MLPVVVIVSVLLAGVAIVIVFGGVCVAVVGVDVAGVVIVCNCQYCELCCC